MGGESKPWDRFRPRNQPHRATAFDTSKSPLFQPPQFGPMPGVEVRVRLRQLDAVAAISIAAIGRPVRWWRTTHRSRSDLDRLRGRSRPCTPVERRGRAGPPAGPAATPPSVATVGRAAVPPKIGARRVVLRRAAFAWAFCHQGGRRWLPSRGARFGGSRVAGNPFGAGGSNIATQFVDFETAIE